MNILLGIIIVLSSIIILKYPEIGFSIMILLPIIKDIVNLSSDSPLVLNLTVIFMVITIWSFLIKYLPKVKTISINKEHLVIFLIFISIVIISILYTNSPKYGMEKLLKVLLFNGFLFIGGIVIFQTLSKSALFINSLQYSILLLSIINTILIIKNIVAGEFVEMLVARFTLTGGNPIGMARTMGLGIIYWLIAIEHSKSFSYKIGCVFALLPISLSLIATNTRGPVLMLLFIILIYIIFFWGKKIKEKFIVFGVVISIAIILLFLLPSNFLNRYVYFFEQNVFNTTTSVSRASSSAMRLIYYNRVFEYFKDYPFSLIFGTGMGNFSTLFDCYHKVSYPHNIFLEVLFEQGLIGFVFLLIGILILVREIKDVIGIDLKEYRHLFLSFVLSFFYFLLNAQLSGDLFDNRYLWLFWGGTIGLLITIKDKGFNKTGQQVELIKC